MTEVRVWNRLNFLKNAFLNVRLIGQVSIGKRVLGQTLITIVKLLIKSPKYFFELNLN